MYTSFSLRSTASSVVTDPPQFHLTAHLRYLNLLRLRAGPPLVPTKLLRVADNQSKSKSILSLLYVGEMRVGELRCRQK